MKITIILFTLLFSIISYSQDVFGDWEEIRSEKGVIIFMRYSDCEMNMGFDEQRILLKIENTNDFSVKVNWETELYYDGDCKNCQDLIESTKTLELPAGDALAGDCSRAAENVLFYYVRFLNNNLTPKPTPELTDFKIVNLQIKQQ